MLTYDQRRDMIVTHALEIWTKNGLDSDTDMRKEIEKTIKDAVNNAYIEGIRDIDWLANALRKLAGRDGIK